MDQNRIPSSSPLQHVNDSFAGRTAGNDAGPSTTTRPASSHQTVDPTVQSSTIAWNHQDPPPPYVQDPREDISDAANARWQGSWRNVNADAGPSQASSTRRPSIQIPSPTDPSSSTSSSLQLPRPGSNGPARTHTLPSYRVASASAAIPIRPADADVDAEAGSGFGSPLLTSEPLNRSASTHPSPHLSSNAPSSLPVPIVSGQPRPAACQATDRPGGLGKRRLRASSLPNADPIFKRRKSLVDIPTPSERWCRALTIRRPNGAAAKFQLQQQRARELGQRLLAGRPPPWSRYFEQLVVAARQPPINVRSLRGLDAHEILKQPQLRHDLLFDTLAFRPINLPSQTPVQLLSPTLPSPGLTTYGSGSATSATHEICHIMDMYWETIEAEITTGCRCTRWLTPGSLAPFGRSRSASADTLAPRQRVLECVCGGWREDLCEEQWWVMQQHCRQWPSRLPELVRSESTSSAVTQASPIG